MPPSDACVLNPESCVRSFILLDAAQERPFLDARKVVIGAVAVRPHGENERAVRRVFILKAGDLLRKPPERLVGHSIGAARLELDDALFAGRTAAIEPDIDQLGNRTGGGEFGETTIAQHGGFQGQLRRDTDLHLLVAWRRTGLEIQNGVSAIDEALDAVGTARKSEGAVA